MKQFGTKTPGKEYRDRPGAYALILRDDGLIASVKGRSSDRLHLPGGGIDEGESEEEALKREVKEEMSREVERCEFVGEAAQYTDASLHGDVNKLCSYFRAELIPGPDGEGDRVTCWVTPEEFAKRAKHEAHVWAVQTFL
ncbi:MAG TPA: NUDIX domain-containing protein [Candidatus Paceibacterota bacterium]|nr:NUDIX domain-containing protein [Candidatus Paceibacterota bacterium]